MRKPIDFYIVQIEGKHIRKSWRTFRCLHDALLFVSKCNPANNYHIFAYSHEMMARVQGGLV